MLPPRFKCFNIVPEGRPADLCFYLEMLKAWPERPGPGSSPEGRPGGRRKAGGRRGRGRVPRRGAEDRGRKWAGGGGRDAAEVERQRLKRRERKPSDSEEEGSFRARAVMVTSGSDKPELSGVPVIYDYAIQILKALDSIIGVTLNRSDSDSRRGRPEFELCRGQAEACVITRSMSPPRLRSPLAMLNLQPGFPSLLIGTIGTGKDTGRMQLPICPRNFQ